MTLIQSIQREREKLKQIRANTNVVVPKGKYSHESNLVMRGGELEAITEEMAALLDDYGRLMGQGEEFGKVVSVLNKLNDFHKKSIEFTATGNDWSVMALNKHKKVNKDTSGVGAGVFGKTWDEIEDMQGGKLTRK